MKRNTIGVVVGRFETPYLHHGHRYLLNAAGIEHDGLCVVLGSHGGNPTSRYPLDVQTRTRMILQLFPKATVLSLADSPSDRHWSQSLDQLLTGTFPDADLTLYGSRQSFLDAYCGTIRVRIVYQVESPSATDIREAECREPLDTDDFRRGAIYGALQRFPIVYSTVDVIPYRFTGQGMEVLLGMKACDEHYSRLIGGFVDASDESQEDAALRELSEEVSGLRVDAPVRIGSMKIRDHRYHGSLDSVLTTLFIARYRSGEPAAADDLDGVHWVPLCELASRTVPLHRPLAQFAEAYFNQHFLTLKQQQHETESIG